MTLHDFLRQNLSSIVMISITIDNESVHYNYWNWFHQQGQFHLLNNNRTIGHILHHGTVSLNDDGSMKFISEYEPKTCVLNFYFGGAKNG